MEKTNAKKNNGPALNGQRERFITSEEKAQYEVFKNGNLPKETIEKWIRNDLQAIMSFVHGCLKDERIFAALVDSYYSRYKSLHENPAEDAQEVSN